MLSFLVLIMDLYHKLGKIVKSTYMINIKEMMIP